MALAPGVRDILVGHLRVLLGLGQLWLGVGQLWLGADHACVPAGLGLAVCGPVPACRCGPAGM